MMQNGFNEMLEEALNNTSVKWDSKLNRWRLYVSKCLEHTSIIELNMSLPEYVSAVKIINPPATANLSELSANLLRKLYNMVLKRNPAEMGMNSDEWIDVISLNEYAGEKCRDIISPLAESVRKKAQIMHAVSSKKVIIGET